MIYRFKSFILDTERLELRSASQPCTVEPQVFSLLIYLIENRDRVVSKDDLIENVWAGRIVSDATLNSRINSARRAVGDSGQAQEVIRTFPRRGFRFIADVVEVGSAERATDHAGKMPAGMSGEEKPSLVVIPFANLSGDPEKAYFAAGITDDIITALSRVRWLFVISRSSAFSYPADRVDVAQVGHDLQVRYILQGSVRAEVRRVRVTAKLIDSFTGRNVWADNYDGELVDVFDLQDQITSNIVASLIPEISLVEVQRARRKRPESLDSWDHYLRASALMYELSLQSSGSAKIEFARAIELDATFAAARAGLAWCLILEAILGWSRRGRLAMEEALEHALAAVGLDQDEPKASCALAAVYTWTSRQDAAEAAARRAVDLDPNMAEAHGILGYSLGFQGKWEASIEALERALQGSPRDPMRWLWYQGFANAHFAGESYDEACRWAGMATDYRSNWIFGYAVAAASAVLLGRTEEGVKAVKKVVSLYPRYSLERVKRNPMWSDDAIKERFFAALREAGTPS